MELRRSERIRQQQPVTYTIYNSDSDSSISFDSNTNTDSNADTDPNVDSDSGIDHDSNTDNNSNADYDPDIDYDSNIDSDYNIDSDSDIDTETNDNSESMEEDVVAEVDTERDGGGEGTIEIESDREVNDGNDESDDANEDDDDDEVVDIGSDDENENDDIDINQIANELPENHNRHNRRLLEQTTINDPTSIINGAEVDVFSTRSGRTIIVDIMMPLGENERRLPIEDLRRAELPAWLYNNENGHYPIIFYFFLGFFCGDGVHRQSTSFVGIAQRSTSCFMIIDLLLRMGVRKINLSFHSKEIPITTYAGQTNTVLWSMYDVNFAHFMNKDHGIIRFVHNRVNFFGGRAVNPYPHAHKLGIYFSGFGTRDLLMDGIHLLIENQIPLYGKLSLLSELLVTNAHLPASVLNRAAGRREAFDTFLTNDVDDIESIPNLPIRGVIAQDVYKLNYHHLMEFLNLMAIQQDILSIWTFNLDNLMDSIMETLPLQQTTTAGLLFRRIYWHQIQTRTIPTAEIIHYLNDGFRGAVTPFIQCTDPECRMVMKRRSFSKHERITGHRNWRDVQLVDRFSRPVTYRYFPIQARILDNGRFGCPIENCTQDFSRNDTIFHHIKTDHLSEEEKIATGFVFPCTMCAGNPRFRDMNSLTRHYTRNFPGHHMTRADARARVNRERADHMQRTYPDSLI
ncbi:hypothetical protein BJ944DRAFT_227094 [Cunninghamella echinulata]|nr:hypothetical protein BJ944DRAFT_227094 [Cunninghamella echinulata]